MVAREFTDAESRATGRFLNGDCAAAVVADGLHGVGLARRGEALQDLVTALAAQRVANPAAGLAADRAVGSDGGSEVRSAVDAWMDAQVRLAVTRDLR
ncbi:MAG: hypothetical protein IRY85_16365 [Micromonosporaceae bacterium]|jgi:hypothetical protein|nr:hypothetical protein [Micromonosporaceae bacterium]